MKSNAVKLRFIELRAERVSYSKIAQELKISKSTCSAWETELGSQIALTRQEQLSDLYERYHMTKAARIRSLGETLNRIDDALDHTTLKYMEPERLLAMKLKYEQALAKEYTGTSDALPMPKDRGKVGNVYYSYADLYDRIRNGEIDKAQAKIEMQAIQAMAQAHDNAVTPLANLELSPLRELMRLEYDDDLDEDLEDDPGDEDEDRYLTADEDDEDDEGEEDEEDDGDVDQDDGDVT